jgi:hypothetical protein
VVDDDPAQRIRSVGWRWRTFEMQGRVMRENHTRTIFLQQPGEPQFDHPRSQQFLPWNLHRRFAKGGPAMWIVFYIATIASLSALGLAPNVVPETKDDDSDA